jgi:hypothetical protein
MNIEFLSTVAVIAPDPSASKRLYVNALGLPLEGGEGGYQHSEQIAGSSPSQSPAERPVPQVSRGCRAVIGLRLRVIASCGRSGSSEPLRYTGSGARRKPEPGDCLGHETGACSFRSSLRVSRAGAVRRATSGTSAPDSRDRRVSWRWR